MKYFTWALVVFYLGTAQASVLHSRNLLAVDGRSEFLPTALEFKIAIASKAQANAKLTNVSDSSSKKALEEKFAAINAKVEFLEQGNKLLDEHAATINLEIDKLDVCKNSLQCQSPIMASIIPKIDDLNRREWEFLKKIFTFIEGDNAEVEKALSDYWDEYQTKTKAHKAALSACSTKSGGQGSAEACTGKAISDHYRFLVNSNNYLNASVVKYSALISEILAIDMLILGLESVVPGQPKPNLDDTI